MHLSQRAHAVAESATIAVSSRAARMKREGVDVIAFGAGEPDFDTPGPLKDAVKRAIDAGQTKYAPAGGIPEAREAVCTKLQRDNGLTYQPNEVIMTCGGKEAIYLALACLIDPGEEVILPAPYWVSFPEQVTLCGGTLKVLQSKDAGFKLRPADIRAALTPRTRAFIFNSPSNPGGFTYSPEETRAVAEVFRGTDVTILADEMYDRLTFAGVRILSMAAVDAETRGRTVTINAASKSYAMTGWRVGYAAGPKPLIEAMTRLQSHTTSGPTTFNQYAVAEALRGDQSSVETMRKEFEKRGRHMHRRLAALRGVECVEPTGAYYCFPNVRKAFSAVGATDSVSFAQAVLEKAHVAVVPGIAFGMDDHVRLSFACGQEQIDKGLDRIEGLLGKR